MNVWLYVKGIFDVCDVDTDIVISHEEGLCLEIGNGIEPVIDRIVLLQQNLHWRFLPDRPQKVLWWPHLRVMPSDVDLVDKLAFLVVEDEAAEEGDAVPGADEDAEFVEDGEFFGIVEGGERVANVSNTFIIRP